jgi:uncharacterized membrane protein YedE/YeeE
MNTLTENQDIRELSIEELDDVNGGFIWIAAVVGGFLIGTGIRMGIDYLLK